MHAAGRRARRPTTAARHTRAGGSTHWVPRLAAPLRGGCQRLVAAAGWRALPCLWAAVPNSACAAQAAEQLPWSVATARLGSTGGGYPAPLALPRSVAAARSGSAVVGSACAADAASVCESPRRRPPPSWPHERWVPSQGQHLGCALPGAWPCSVRAVASCLALQGCCPSTGRAPGRPAGADPLGAWPPEIRKTT